MENDEAPKRNKGGRPKTRLGAPKSASFSARISQEIRDAMTTEAARTGRSIADVAEMWLEDARRGRASVDAQLGGSKAANTLRQMAALARLVYEEIGDFEQDKAARYALVQGWKKLIIENAPQSLPTKSELAVARAEAEVSRRILDAFIAIDQLDENIGPMERDEIGLRRKFESGGDVCAWLAGLVEAIIESGEIPDTAISRGWGHLAASSLRQESEKALPEPYEILRTFFEDHKPSGPISDAIRAILSAKGELDRAVNVHNYETAEATKRGRMFVTAMSAWFETDTGTRWDDFTELEHLKTRWTFYL